MKVKSSKQEINMNSERHCKRDQIYDYLMVLLLVPWWQSLDDKCLNSKWIQTDDLFVCQRKPHNNKSLNKNQQLCRAKQLFSLPITGNHNVINKWMNETSKYV